MEKKHIITIAGNLGGGKSSASTRVSEILGYQKKSTGDFMRQIAKDRNITLEDLSKIAEKDASIDESIDSYSRDLGKQQNIVLDSRLGFHFIPESFKVFLYCDPIIAAERILQDAKDNPNRHNETKDEMATVDQVASSITKRSESERKRYSELYNITNYQAFENYDLVINTGLLENTLEKVPEIIIEGYKKWLGEK